MNYINNQYQLIKKLSAGSYGVVYEGEDIQNKTSVAIKIEKKEKPQTLEREVQVLSRLQKITGIPQIYWSGTHNGQNILVMQLLSKDLGYYLKEYRKFSLKTVLMIADQLLQTLRNIHQKSILHRDLKPENLMYHQRQVYIVDFGISKIYRDSNQKHIPFRDGRPFVGTTRYAPIAAHKGHELSRKDDLETLIYILVLFLKGVLPWQNQILQNNKEKQKLIGEKKIKLGSTEICQDLPIEFQKALDHIKSVGFSVEPDYEYLINLFRKLGQRHGFEYDNLFDWCKEEDIIAQAKMMQQSEKIQHFSLKCQSLQIPSTMECIEKKVSSISNIIQNPMQISQSAVIVEINSEGGTLSDDSTNYLYNNYQQLENFSNLYKNHLQIMKEK
ncbi:unnamed protein product [Paramecium pentaurelia]|uniref:Casein kinase I n=1 Tax=Paramecium pentaurelia TaxID=43138 RepID=A0A8S1X6C2_9CILI|nr:unnamed protein product [Paramecium pentaurelia]